jgi:hypothetical protein
MDKLYPIIRRKRRPLIQENPEMLKADRLLPVAIVPLVASAPESMSDEPTPKSKKSRDVATKN